MTQRANAQRGHSVGRRHPWASRKAEKLSLLFPNNARDCERGKGIPGGCHLAEAYSLTESILAQAQTCTDCDQPTISLQIKKNKPQ